MVRRSLVGLLAVLCMPINQNGQQIGPEIRIEKPTHIGPVKIPDVQIGPPIRIDKPKIDPAENLRNLQHAAENTAATAQKAVDDTAKTLKKAAKDADQARLTALQDIHNTAKKAAYDTALAAYKAARDAAATANKAAEDANRTSIVAMIDAANTVKKAADDTVATARKAADDAARGSRKAAQDADIARRKALQDVNNTAKKAAYDAASTAKKAADDVATTTRKALNDALSTARKANQDVANALAKAADDATKTAVKGIRDVQATKDKAYADAAEVGMRALPAELRNGVKHLGEEAKKEILKYPIIASALLAVLKSVDPLMEAEIRALLKETCDPSDVIARLSSSSQKGLTDTDKNLGALSTPWKTDDVFGWINTGCRAQAVGVPVVDAVHSSDDLWTIDVQLKGFIINGVSMPAITRYLRIEVEPIGRAHDFCEHHLVTTKDTLRFGGPVLIDTDGPFLEVHPIDDFQLVVFHRPEAPATATKPPATKPPTASVKPRAKK